MAKAVCSVIFYLLTFISCPTECSQDRNVIQESHSVARDDVRDNDGRNAGTVTITDYMESRADRGDVSIVFLDSSKEFLEMNADEKDTLSIGHATDAWDVEDRYAKRSGRLAKRTDRYSEMFQSYKRSSAVERTIRKREVNTMKQGKPDGTEDAVIKQKKKAEAEDEVFFKEMLQRIETYCPGEGFCPAKNAPKMNQTNCCLNCRCEKSCKITGSCCADIQTTRDDNFLYIPPVNAKCMNPSIFAKPKYEFITSCPESSSREEKAKCELSVTEGQNHTVTSAETIPVLDRARHTNYWNIHCAVCNGASLENLTMWIQHTICSFDLGGTRLCHSSIVQPEEPEVEFTKCYTDDDNIISTCNRTGQWDVFDPFLLDACHHLHLHIHIRKHLPGISSMANGGAHRFHNVFCAVCNGVNISIDDGTCWTGNELNTRFTTLIRHSLPLDKLPGPIRECGPSQKKDPISGKCKEVTCSYPLEWDSYQSECVEMVFFNEAIYDVPFSIHLKMNTSLTSLTRFRQYLEDKFTTIKKKSSSLCGFETHVKVETPFTDLDEFDKPLEELPLPAIADAYVIMYVSERTRYATKAHEATLSYNLFKDAFSSFGRGVDPQTASFTNVLAANRVQYYERNYIAGFSLDSFDPWTLLPNIDPRVTKVTVSKRLGGTTPLRRRKREAADFWSVYENFYDKYAMIQPAYITGDYNDCRFKMYDQAYGRSFISCPTFEYNLTDYSISRHPDGIELRGRDVKFGFDEFRSVNETHVRICVDSVLNKAKFLMSSSMAMRYSITNVVMAAVVVTVGMY